MTIYFTSKFNNITASKSSSLIQSRIALMGINEFCDEFEYQYNDFYTFFSDNQIKFNWMSEYEFFQQFQQDAEDYILQTDRNIQYVYIGGQHYMLVRQPDVHIEYPHFIQEMMLAYYKHPDNTYDAGETTLSIDVSDLENHPKVKCIYERLVQNGSLQHFLRQFDNRTGFMNLEIKVAPLSGKYAETGYDRNTGKVSITINQNKIQSITNVELAETILHESIHAMLIGYYIQILQIPENERENFAKNNFSGIYDYYTRFKGTTGANSYQHELMAAHYMQIVVDKLLIFDPNLTTEQAEALFWEGLRSTIEYNRLPISKRNDLDAELDFVRNNFPKSCQP